MRPVLYQPTTRQGRWFLFKTLRGCNVCFANGKILPMNSDSYDTWYRSLPIHKMFLDEKESEIHYLAPDDLQPDFPFVYLDIGMLIVNLVMMTETNEFLD